MHIVQEFEYSVSRVARGPLSLAEGEYILLLGTVIISSFLIGHLTHICGQDEACLRALRDDIKNWTWRRSNYEPSPHRPPPLLLEHHIQGDSNIQYSSTSTSVRPSRGQGMDGAWRRHMLLSFILSLTLW